MNFLWIINKKHLAFNTFEISLLTVISLYEKDKIIYFNDKYFLLYTHITLNSKTWNAFPYGQ